MLITDFIKLFDERYFGTQKIGNVTKNYSLAVTDKYYTTCEPTSGKAVFVFVSADYSGESGEALYSVALGLDTDGVMISDEETEGELRLFDEELLKIEAAASASPDANKYFKKLAKDGEKEKEAELLNFEKSIKKMSSTSVFVSLAAFVLLIVFILIAILR